MVEMQVAPAAVVVVVETQVAVVIQVAAAVVVMIVAEVALFSILVYFIACAVGVYPVYKHFS